MSEAAGNNREPGCSLVPGRPRRQTLRAADAGLVALALVAVAVYRLPVLAPGLYCSAPVKDVGPIRAGQTARARYRLWNLHPWALTIRDAYPACGCTVLSPQGKLPLHVRAFGDTDLARIRPGTPAPRLKEVVFVATDDRADPLVLRITGRVLSAQSVQGKESLP